LRFGSTLLFGPAFDIARVHVPKVEWVAPSKPGEIEGKIFIATAIFTSV
jgi:hypothetical protein